MKILSDFHSGETLLHLDSFALINKYTRNCIRMLLFYSQVSEVSEILGVYNIKTREYLYVHM